MKLRHYFWPRIVYQIKTKDSIPKMIFPGTRKFSQQQISWDPLQRLNFLPTTKTLLPTTHEWISMNPPESDWTTLFSHISRFERFWICLNLSESNKERRGRTFAWTPVTPCELDRTCQLWKMGFSQQHSQQQTKILISRQIEPLKYHCYVLLKTRQILWLRAIINHTDGVNRATSNRNNHIL